MLFNSSKTVSLTICLKSQVEEILPLTFNNTQSVKSHTPRLDAFKEHVESISKRVNQLLGKLQYFKYYLPRKCLIYLYHRTVLPNIDYCDLIYANCRTVEKNTVDRPILKQLELWLVQ